jgi:hypothetical protein
LIYVSISIFGLGTNFKWDYKIALSTFNRISVPKVLAYSYIDQLELILAADQINSNLK